MNYSAKVLADMTQSHQNEDLIVGKTAKIRKRHRIKDSGKIKSKILKSKGKKRGVRIWNKNPVYFRVRGSTWRK